MYESKYKYKHKDRRERLLKKIEEKPIEPEKTVHSLGYQALERISNQEMQFNNCHSGLLMGNPYLNGQAAQQLPQQYRYMFGIG